MDRRFRPLVFVLCAAAIAGVLAGCAPAGDPLKGTSWKVSGWTVSSIDPASVTITAAFADGKVTGNGGVNSYGADYTLGANGAITIGEIVHTEMAGPDPQMRAENAYFPLLAGVKAFRIDGDTLHLLDAGGNDSIILTRASK